jgi:hypothetical protein
MQTLLKKDLIDNQLDKLFQPKMIHLIHMKMGCNQFFCSRYMKIGRTYFDYLSKNNQKIKYGV